MSKKDSWKDFGKKTGRAFKNFGKALWTTGKVTFDDEEKVDENGNSKLKEVWSETGKSFGSAGQSLGKAACDTFKDEEDEKKETKIDKDNAIDV